jgi:hypothetical protein
VEHGLGTEEFSHRGPQNSSPITKSVGEKEGL